MLLWCSVDGVTVSHQIAERAYRSTGRQTDAYQVCLLSLSVDSSPSNTCLCHGCHADSGLFNSVHPQWRGCSSQPRRTSPWRLHWLAATYGWWLLTNCRMIQWVIRLLCVSVTCGEQNYAAFRQFHRISSCLWIRDVWCIIFDSGLFSFVKYKDTDWLQRERDILIFSTNAGVHHTRLRV